MTDETDDRSERWALPASAIAHALVAALVIFGLPLSLPQPQEEQAIAVTIEPLPEVADAAPPPPPPPPVEPAEPEEPLPAAAQEQAAGPAVPVLQPVVKYGETDAGPRESLDGSGSEDDSETPTQSVADAEETTEQAERENAVEDEPSPADTAESTETAESDASGQPDSADDESTGASTPQLVVSTAGEDAPPLSSEPKPAATAAASEPELKEARRLFSRSATGGPTATTAMANLPRGVRAGRLCATELELQLINGAYSPNRIPSYDLHDATVLKVRDGEFFAGGAWHRLSFECQVDADATSVVSFAFHVGAPLSREETQRRGLPSR